MATGNWLAVGARYLGDAIQQMAGKDGEAFALDFRHDPPLWRSTDDDFWEDVMRFFKVW